RRLGQIDAAQKHYADAEQLYRAERANLGLANVLKAMGDLESRLGQIDAAQKHYADAEQLYRVERANLGLANVLQAMGDLERLLEKTDAAISKYKTALSLYNSEREPMGRVYCMAELCRAYAKKKDEPRFLEFAQATKDAFVSVDEDVADYAIDCVREAKDIMISHTKNKYEEIDIDEWGSET
ncbi:MAG: tetratricopeptide repeat protein, partial [Oscillospiraceae bacterium]|nr:tetratricopeptide repeat protein [Oscillospiraceae bacterium]